MPSGLLESTDLHDTIIEYTVTLRKDEQSTGIPTSAQRFDWNQHSWIKFLPS
ncbi:hypothetical protein DPMN_059691 [Dreissena polymorpha]|uniref:Uncharacterized protein n=1 Tax=Dreissena polymorpha TaxID=45954 RepID=A0A9D4HFB4_DREPO|nr:hypothetical protein DPMN_059691 [Dreissena polymorpha]